MQDIADALGIRKPSLYKHFASKDALYAEVLDQALTPFSVAIDGAMAGPNPDEAFRQLPSAALRILSENPNTARLLLQELIQLDRPPHRRVGHWLNLLFSKADHVLALAGGRSASDSIDVRLHLITLLNIVLGFTVAEPLLPGNTIPRAELVERETRILQAVISALQALGSASMLGT